MSETQKNKAEEISYMQFAHKASSVKRAAEELKIRVITAPYSAEAQLAYMVREGMIDFAVSESCDLAAMSCLRILKISTDDDNWLLFDAEGQSAPNSDNLWRMFMDMGAWRRAFLYAMSGSSHQAHLPGFDSFALLHFFSKKAQVSDEKLCEELAQHMGSIHGQRASDFVERSLLLAYTFWAQVVLDPATNSLRRLNEPHFHMKDWELYAGSCS